MWQHLRQYPAGREQTKGASAVRQSSEDEETRTRDKVGREPGGEDVKLTHSPPPAIAAGVFL